MASQTGNDELHPLDEMVEFLKVQLKAQEERRQKEEKRRQIEFALQQITMQTCFQHFARVSSGRPAKMILVNGSFEYELSDGLIAVRILTAFLRGSSFEVTNQSIGDIVVKSAIPFKLRQLDTFLQSLIKRQKEILFHLLGKLPRVIESKQVFVHGVLKEEQEIVLSAVFSYD